MWLYSWIGFIKCFLNTYMFFTDFSSKDIFKHGGCLFNIWSCYSNMVDFTNIPFLKNNYVLHKKWYVKHTHVFQNTLICTPHTRSKCPSTLEIKSNSISWRELYYSELTEKGTRGARSIGWMWYFNFKVNVEIFI